MEAAVLAERDHIATPILIGSKTVIAKLWSQFGGSGSPVIFDPKMLSQTQSKQFLTELMSLSKYKSLSTTDAQVKIQDPLILGCLCVKAGIADGFVGGATRTTADTLRAVFSIIGLAHRTPTLFGFFLIERHGSRVDASPFVILADCAVIPDPSVKQLAQIGLGAANAYEFLTGDQPRVAFLSFSTNGSAEHPVVDKVRQAFQMAHEKAPNLMMAGEWQADAALDTFTAKVKGVGDHPMAGNANVLVAPNLECGNIAYKLVQRLGNCRAVGPILWGTAKPANDLSRGCSMEDVLDMMTLTSLQAKASGSLMTSSPAEKGN